MIFQKPLPGHALAAHIDEQTGFLRVCDHSRADLGQIGRQGTHGSGIERDDAVFSARSAAFDKAARKADVRDVQEISSLTRIPVA